MTSPYKIIVFTEQFKNGDPLFEPLKNAGYSVEVNETFRLPKEDELIAKLADNVVATIAGGRALSPHVSGMDKMTERKVTERCVSNILNFLGGQKDAIRPYVVNPETLMENSK